MSATTTTTRESPIRESSVFNVAEWTHAKVFVMTRDEYDLIEDFLTFYTAVFGAKSIVVIDNGSTDPRVLDAYRRFEALGVRIHADVRPMTSQKDVLTEHMLRYTNTCEFMLPLDTDEFMLDLGEETLQPRRVWEHLISFPPDVSIIEYNAVYFSVPQPSAASYVDYAHVRPAVDMDLFYTKPFDKIIVRAHAFRQMYPGNHNALVSFGRREKSHRLGIAHFHDTGIRRLYERTINAVRSYRFVDLADTHANQLRTAAAFTQSVGGHHAVYYIQFLARLMLLRAWHDTESQDAKRSISRQTMQRYCAAIDAALNATSVDPATLSQVVELAVGLAMQHKQHTSFPDDAQYQAEFLHLLFAEAWPQKTPSVQISQVIDFLGHAATSPNML